MIISLILLSTICGKYLYAHASKNKIEWTLFGFLGSVNAILIFWLHNHFQARRRKGKSIFNK